MPHEKINFISEVWPTAVDGGEGPPRQLIVGWNRGWVQVSVAPFRWESTSEWAITSLTAGDIDRAIKALKRARRAAFGRVNAP